MGDRVGYVCGRFVCLRGDGLLSTPFLLTIVVEGPWFLFFARPPAPSSSLPPLHDRPVPSAEPASCFAWTGVGCTPQGAGEHCGCKGGTRRGRGSVPLPRYVGPGPRTVEVWGSSKRAAGGGARGRRAPRRRTTTPASGSPRFSPSPHPPHPPSPPPRPHGPRRVGESSTLWVGHAPHHPPGAPSTCARGPTLPPKRRHEWCGPPAVHQRRGANAPSPRVCRHGCGPRRRRCPPLGPAGRHPIDGGGRRGYIGAAAMAAAHLRLPARHSPLPHRYPRLTPRGDYRAQAADVRRRVQARAPVCRCLRRTVRVNATPISVTLALSLVSLC